jgi:hypothetical protein
MAGPNAPRRGLSKNTVATVAQRAQDVGGRRALDECALRVDHHASGPGAIAESEAGLPASESIPCSVTV